MSAERSILLVDDDPGIVEMTSLLLGQAGYRVHPALSGEEALLRVRETRPDIVLLDVNMPGMDGWEVLRILQSDEGTSSIPVVMFSVKYEIRDKVHALQQGASDYITKPFSTEALLDRVERIFLDRIPGAPA
jgi:DNA-binding response OmpR family regulator